MAPTHEFLLQSMKHACVGLCVGGTGLGCNRRLQLKGCRAVEAMEEGEGTGRGCMLHHQHVLHLCCSSGATSGAVDHFIHFMITGLASRRQFGGSTVPICCKVKFLRVCFTNCKVKTVIAFDYNQFNCLLHSPLPHCLSSSSTTVVLQRHLVCCCCPFCCGAMLNKQL